MLAAGLARVVDFQDVAYGSEYLDRVERFAALGDAPLTRPPPSRSRVPWPTTT